MDENIVDEPTSIPRLIPSEIFSHIHWLSFIDSASPMFI